MRWDVIIVGAGAAGLLAACRAAERGRRVLLLEKNRKAGVKILMSGGTRCNLTHSTDRRGIVDAFGRQGRFLHSSLASLGPRELVDLFERQGVATKVESTGKVFPVSDRAVDVVRALLRRLEQSGAHLSLDEPVLSVKKSADRFEVSTSRRVVSADRLLLTTGGQSYPGCGTTGDGYAWLAEWGHAIVPPHPALVPLKSPAEWVRGLQGVTLPDVDIRLVADADARRPIASRRGSFLFTHFGISGPTVLDVSRGVTAPGAPPNPHLSCDFLPERRAEELAQDLANAPGRGAVPSKLAQWLPRRLAEAIVSVAGLPNDRRFAELSRRERASLVESLKGARLPVAGTLGFKKAEVTAGGVDLREVDSRTMQSRVVPSLYLAGEILDLDGPIGGYNFQAAFSTGWLAGTHV